MEQTTNSHSEHTPIKTFVAIFILISILAKIVFYEEKLTTIMQTIAAFVWLFALPGYFITKIWKEQNLNERIVISIPISAALLGIASYHFALWGLPLSIQAWILPPAVVLFSAILHKLFKQTT